MADEPPDHGIGRSRGDYLTKVHQFVDGCGRPLVILIGPGQGGDSPMLGHLLDSLKVNRPGPGGPRTRPDALLADKAHGAPAHRRTLAARRITTVIPERDDQIANRKRRGQRGGRPPNFDPVTYRRRNVVERSFNVQKQWRALASPLRQTRHQLPRRTRPTCHRPTDPRFSGPALAALELQRISDEVIRPLSHSLIEPPEPDPQPPMPSSIREVGSRWVADVVAALFIPVSWMVVAVSILTFVYGAATFGPLRGVWLTITSGVLLFVATRVVNTAVEFSRRQWGAGASLLAAGLLVAVTAFLITRMWRWLSRDWPYSETIAWAVLLIVAVAVLLAPIKVAIILRERALANALQAQEQLRWEATRLRDRLWQQRHNIGRGLHGQVQAEMHAAAFRLAQAGAATDPLSVDSAKGLVMAVVRGLAADTASVDLDLVALRISATWQGLCRFSFVVDPVVGARLAQDAVAAHTVGEILTEATGNAVRHGRSTYVEVVIAPDTQRTVRVDIVDNGTTGHGQAGLGTRMFDSLCLNWTTTSASDGTIVTAVVPVL